jgi:uncharacterized protein (DUF1330 family)
MKVNYKIALALLAGVAIGAAAAHGLNAQTKPIAYVVAEIDVTNQDAYAKEYVPLATKALGEGGSGYKRVAIGKPVSIEGAPPKSRVVINTFANMDAAIAAFNSPAYKEARNIGNKYATFRIIAVEAAQ